MLLNRRSAFVVLGLALSVLSQGCVSLHAHDEVRKEAEALKVAYKAADKIVGQYKDQIGVRDAEIRKLHEQIKGLHAERVNARGMVEAANQRIEHANQAIVEERDRLQEEYAQMLVDLKNEGGGNFVINESTGGVVLENDIFFSPGKAELKPEAKSALDALIAKLNESKFQSASIEVAGHSDTDPITHSKWADNLQLSGERARSVLKYFLSKGVTSERAYFSGYGATRPRSSQKEENRRVEIVLHEQ